jgi:hypothetical protein
MTARTHRKRNTVEMIFISEENGQVLAGADDLIRRIDRKVILNKNITT